LAKELVKLGQKETTGETALRRLKNKNSVLSRVRPIPFYRCCTWPFAEHPSNRSSRSDFAGGAGINRIDRRMPGIDARSTRPSGSEGRARGRAPGPAGAIGLLAAWPSRSQPVRLGPGEARGLGERTPRRAAHWPGST
jgi:hypothetical protein